MKIILLSIGTRGDMEPFIAIGEMLKQRGHKIICAFPEQFRNLAANAHLPFESLGTEYIESLESDIGRTAMGQGGSGLRKFIANIKLGSLQTEINKALVFRQQEIIENHNPDRILYNGKAVYPILWGLEHNGKNILICPLPYMHYVSNHSHVAFNRDFGPLLNKLTYILADFGLAITVLISAKWLKLDRKITLRKIREYLSSNRAIYTISPSLFTRPDDWNENPKVLGFYQRDKNTDWQPDNELTGFLERYREDRVLLVTLGSMINPEPMEKTKILISILERHRIPAIINIASGGLQKPKKYDSELIHFVPTIPYEWIFPKIYGVIHHGGSGTTQLGLKYGCATMIIPHIIDQFVWDSIIYTIGAGPKGIKIDRVTASNLEPKILALLNNRSFKKKAEQVARNIAQEDFREELYHAIVR